MICLSMPLPFLFSMKIYGVLGYPAKHSLSPAMHNAAFKECGIDAAYKIFEVAPAKLPVFFSSLAGRNIAGFNVTVPYKETVLQYLHKISVEASFIGAVNTVKLVRGRLHGFNTDGEGFVRHAKEGCGVTFTGKTVAVLGAGGAGKGVCFHVCKERPGELRIYNRDRAKSLVLYNRLVQYFDGIRVKIIANADDLCLRDADMLINATSVGMRPSDGMIVPRSALHRDLFVYDLVYNRNTELLEAAAAAGCRTSNGLGMLLYQGMLAFEVWTGKKAPQECMEDSLRRAFGRR